MKTSASKRQETAVHRTEQCLESSSTREQGQRAALMAQEVPAEPVLGTPATVHTWTPQGLGQQLLLSGNTCITFVVKKTSPEGFIIMWILL